MTLPPIASETLEELGRLLHEDPEGGGFAWFDKDTRELVATTSMYGLDPEAIPDDDDDDDWGAPQTPARLPEWAEAERRQVEAICADTTGRYLWVPIGANRAGSGLLDGFARTLADSALRSEVLDAMRGRGAFRRVKDALHRRGKLDLWHRYEEERQLASARDWLASEGIEVGEAGPAGRR